MVTKRVRTGPDKAAERPNHSPSTATVPFITQAARLWAENLGLGAMFGQTFVRRTEGDSLTARRRASRGRYRG